MFIEIVHLNSSYCIEPILVLKEKRSSVRLSEIGCDCLLSVNLKATIYSMLSYIDYLFLVNIRWKNNGSAATASIFALRES